MMPLHSFLMNLVPCQKLNPFLRPEWFFWVCNCVSGENGTIVMSLPISSWDWLSLSHKSYLLLSLQQHHFLHNPFHFGVFCFLMMLSGKFSEFSWYKLTCNNYRCCCSVFSIPVSFSQILFSFTLSSLIFGKFCFWNSLCREASFAGLLIVDLLSLGWAVWKWTEPGSREEVCSQPKVCSICGHGTRVYTFMGQVE